jgi:hypothetical protein
MNGWTVIISLLILGILIAIRWMNDFRRQLDECRARVEYAPNMRQVADFVKRAIQDSGSESRRPKPFTTSSATGAGEGQSHRPAAGTASDQPEDDDE